MRSSGLYKRWSGTESDTCDEAAAEFLAQRPQPVEIPPADPSARLDLDRDDPAVIELQYEVDLDAVVCVRQ